MELLQENKLDYTISKLPIKNELTGNYENTKFGVYNESNKKLLSVVSNHYEIIQNNELFPLIFDKFQEIKEIQKFNIASSYDNGAKVLISANLGKFTLPNNDIIEKNISVIAQHDGKGAVKSFINPYRIWCNNQINAISNNFEFTFKIRHSKKGLEIIGNIEKYITMVDNEFKLIQDTYNNMVHKKVSKNQIIKIVSSMFDLKNDTKKGQTMISNQINDIMIRFNNPNEIIEEKNSQWNLYNSIQGTLQHEPRRLGSNHDLNVMTGSIYNQSQDILNQIINLSENDNWENDLINNEISELIGDLVY
jgi:hypothetical protein